MHKRLVRGMRMLPYIALRVQVWKQQMQLTISYHYNRTTNIHNNKTQVSTQYLHKIYNAGVTGCCQEWNGEHMRHTSYPPFLLTCYSWLSNSDQTLHTININASCNSTQHIVQNLQSQIQKVEPALRWIKLNKYRWGTVIDNKSLHDMECYL